LRTKRSKQEKAFLRNKKLGRKNEIMARPPAPLASFLRTKRSKQEKAFLRKKKLGR
jgi:hypothetical protein